MTMESHVAATLLLLLLSSIQRVSSFVPSQTNTRHSTHLHGTIKFVGNANARLETPPVLVNDGDEEKSLTNFLASSASDPVLLGSKKGATGAISQCEKVDNNGNGEGELWECKQASIGWFGLKLVPIFVNLIEKNPSRGNLVISILDAKTEVTSGSRLGNTLASAMKRSKFEGRNAITWKNINDGGSNDDGTESYTLEGNLKLTLTINLPPFLPLPPGFNKIGSKIVESTCKERLKQNLSDISNAYLVWATTPE